MANPYVNKVVFGGRTLIDTSEVTVTPDKLAYGVTALDKSGALIVGTANVGGEVVYYCTCDTAAATQAKAVTVIGIATLHTGLSLRVKFANGQGYDGTPTLILNSFEAKSIYRNGRTAATQYEWSAGEVIDLVYDGTVWIMVDGNALKGM